MRKRVARISNVGAITWRLNRSPSGLVHYELGNDFWLRFRSRVPAHYYGKGVNIIKDGPVAAIKIRKSSWRLSQPLRIDVTAPWSRPVVTALTVVDPLFREVEKIARAWNWSVKRTERWINSLFVAYLDHQNSPVRSVQYYDRTLGRSRLAAIMHKAFRWLFTGMIVSGIIIYEVACSPIS